MIEISPKPKKMTEIPPVRTKVGFPHPTSIWTEAQKAQNNEFVENRLEN